MLSEYGADAVEGVHSDPPIAFSEEFQAAYLRAHFGVFDELMQAREPVPVPSRVSPPLAPADRSS